MTTTRTRALDAAIELVGTAGLRALTHNRVDERAALPRGSTSNYFRTRAALVAGVLDRIVEREMAEVAGSTFPASEDQYVDTLCGLLEFTTKVNRTLTVARLAVFVEASHDEGLQAALGVARQGYEAATAAALAVLGAPQPVVAARTVMACLEGLILHRVVRDDESDVRPVVAAVVRAVLSAAPPAGPTAT